MKKTATLFRVLAFILMIGFLASCSKHTDKPANPGGGGNSGGDNNGGGGQTESYYVKAKMDGTTVNHAGTVKALHYVDEYNRHILRIIGEKGNGSTDDLEVIIISAEDATVGQYTEGNQDNYAIYGIYAPQNRADDNGIYMAGQSSTDGNAPFIINITEITSKYVKGTFSGAFFDEQGAGSNEKKFTNGEFIAPIVNE